MQFAQGNEDFFSSVGATQNLNDLVFKPGGF